MSDRYNFYKEIHKGVRALLLDLISQAGRTDFANASSLENLKETTRNAFLLLESHAHHENTFIGPELERLLPALAKSIGGAHDSHEPEMEELLFKLESIDPSSSDAASRGHAFVVALSKFAAELTLHMAEEEQVVMPALWTVRTDEELMAIEQRLVSSIPPEKMGSFLRWMIPAMNHPERVHLFSSMKAGAPAEVFANVRALASSILSPAEDEALTAGLAVVAA